MKTTLTTELATRFPALGNDLLKVALLLAADGTGGAYRAARYISDCIGGDAGKVRAEVASAVDAVRKASR